MKSSLALLTLTLLLTGCSVDSKGQHDATLKPPTAAARQSDPVYSYVDAIRSDLSDGKVQIITHVMRLTPEESKVFWPIYHDYEEDRKRRLGVDADQPHRIKYRKLKV